MKDYLKGLAIGIIIAFSAIKAFPPKHEAKFNYIMGCYDGEMQILKGMLGEDTKNCTELEKEWPK